MPYKGRNRPLWGPSAQLGWTVRKMYSVRAPLQERTPPFFKWGNRVLAGDSGLLGSPAGSWQNSDPPGPLAVQTIWL